MSQAPSGADTADPSGVSSVTLDVPSVPSIPHGDDQETAPLTAKNLDNLPGGTAESAVTEAPTQSTSAGTRHDASDARSVSALSAVSREGSAVSGVSGAAGGGGRRAGSKPKKSPANPAGGLRRNMLDPAAAGSGGRSRASSRAGSTRSHRRGKHHNDGASAADRSIASDQDLTNVDVAAVEPPPGVAPLWLSQSTQSLFRAVADEHVTRSFPLKIVGRDEVLEDLASRGVVSDFDKVAAGVRASDQEDFLIVYDVDRLYGENFYICLTAEARRAELDRISKAEVAGAGAADIDDTKEVGVLTVSATYNSLGSEVEVDDHIVKPTRPRLALAITRRRREFGAPARFGDRDAHDGLSESRSIKDPNYELRRVELDRGCQAVPEKATTSAQTTWNRPVNMAIQYSPVDVEEEKRLEIAESDSLAAFLRRAWPAFEHALQQNETVNVTLDDFALLAKDEAGIGTQADSMMKELTSFADLHYCKDRYVPCIDWQPSRKGILAVSVCENLSFDERVETSGRVSNSYVLVWNFADPIQPQLVLEAPSDVLCFRFNPADPGVIAGGCINGQVIVWDIGQVQDEIRRAGRTGGGANATANAAAAAAAAAASGEGGSAADGVAAAAEGGGADAANNGGNGMDAGGVGGGGGGATTPVGGKATPTDDKNLDPEQQQMQMQQEGRGVGGKSVPVIPYLFVSSIEHGHRRAVTDLRWITGGRTVGAQGKTSTTHGGGCSQFATTAADGQVLFWDTSRAMRDPRKFDLAWVPSHRVPLNRLDGTASDIGGCALCIGDAAKGTTFFVASEEGDLVWADWSPVVDEKPKYVTRVTRGHYGDCRSIERSPFMNDVVLTSGDWSFAIWKEDIDAPVFVAPPSSTRVTCARWSPTRPGVVFCGKEDGKVEIWDLTDRSHEPSITQTVTSASVETIEFWPVQGDPEDKSGLNANNNPVESQGRARGSKRQQGRSGAHGGNGGGRKRQQGGNLLAVGDALGTTHILRLPRPLTRPSPTERNGTKSFIEWESARVGYMTERRKIRAAELQAFERESALRMDREDGEEPEDEYEYQEQEVRDDDDVDPIEAERAEEAYRQLEANFKAELGIADDAPDAREDGMDDVNGDDMSRSGDSLGSAEGER